MRTPMSSSKTHLDTLLEPARPFLLGKLDRVDPNLLALVGVLRAAGAGECWHKHGSFIEHLVSIYKTLKLWGCSDPVCLCGLFHSAYSNSYVNLAIFDPSTGRDTVRGYIGAAAEHLVHLFCIVPRQPLIHDDLLFHYSDAELVEHLKASEVSLRKAKESGVSDKSEEWRKKINLLVPEDGVVVKHIKTGEDVRVSRKIVGIFMMMTMADFSDQLTGWQDELLENNDGRYEMRGNKYTTLWPGDGKPGLWMNSASRMGAIYALIAREEAIFSLENPAKDLSNGDLDLKLDLVMPPVFERCTRVLDAEDQKGARDLYWEAIGSASMENAEGLLVRSIERNPFVGEPHLELAQVYLSQKRFEEGEREAEKGLTLMLEWATPWDKRVSWEGWVAWARVLLMKAKERSWPQSTWGILNLGLVR